MLDIDHFKRVNDLHGHAVGDQALKTVAQACLTQLRSGDVIGRLGGEEFGVLLPETGWEEARRAGQRLCQAVRALEMRHGEASVTVTLSLGLAALKPGRNFEDLMRAADQALYQAKAAGRDRLECAPGPGL